MWSRRVSIGTGGVEAGAVVLGWYMYAIAGGGSVECVLEAIMYIFIYTPLVSRLLFAVCIALCKSSCCC